MNKVKNVKISERHHDTLKKYCDRKGLKIYRVIEKWIEQNCDIEVMRKSNDIYGE